MPRDEPLDGVPGLLAHALLALERGRIVAAEEAVGDALRRVMQARDERRAADVHTTESP